MSLRFSRKTDYALVALAVLAHDADGKGDALSARAIAQRHHLPQRLLMNLLKRLAAAGIVVSQRGAGGGYRLARPAARITVAEIFLAIEGPLRLALCCDEDEAPACTSCALTAACPVEEAIRGLNEAMFDLLRNVTLDDLIHHRLPARQAAQSRLVPLSLAGR